MNMDGASFESGASGSAPASWRDGILLHEGSQLWGDVVGGRDSQDLTVEAEDERALGLAQPDRILGQRLEDRLEIEGGPPDHLEELAGRRLLIEGLGEVAIPRLQLLEQADVLDGDDRLVGKGLDHFDLHPQERSYFTSPKAEHADRDVRAEHRSRENRSEPFKGLHDGNAVLRITTNVFDVNGGTGEDRATHATAPIRPHREDLFLHDRNV